MARELAGTGPDTVVVAVGGDGTVHEVANGLLRGGQGRPEPALAILAAGSGNDFARHLGLPRDPAGLADLLRAGTTRRVDAGHLAWPGGEEWFVNVASFGFTAAANRIADKAGKRHGGVAYVTSAVRAIASHRDYTVALGADGAVVAPTALATGVLANAAWFGAGMHVAPGALVDDGLLQLLTVQGAGRFRLLGLLAQVFRGRHLRSRAVTMVPTRSVRMEWAGDLPFEADGELVGARSPLVATVHPGVLRVVARGNPAG